MNFSQFNNQFELIQTNDFKNIKKNKLKNIYNYKNKVSQNYFLINLPKVQYGYILPSVNNYYKKENLIYCINKKKKKKENIKIQKIIIMNQHREEKHIIINKLNNFIKSKVILNSLYGYYNGVLSFIWEFKNRIIFTLHLRLKSSKKTKIIKSKFFLHENKLIGNLKLNLFYNGLFIGAKKLKLISKGVYTKKGQLI